MAFKMKGEPMVRNYGAPFENHKGGHPKQTPEQIARSAELKKNMKNSGLSEEKYQKMRAEQKALSGK